MIMNEIYSDSGVSFKVDVDTHDGMKNGVPKLLKIFGRFGIKATFFLSYGPDNAGKAIFQIFTQKGFLKKMVRTKAPNLYGWRTILSGTLLPARPIACAFPDLVRRIESEGHEVGVHAWDHRYWQDNLLKMSIRKIASEFVKSFDAYERILGKKPFSVASPGWQATPASLYVEDSLELLYASDFRNGKPCFPKMEEYTSKTLQIPTTTRCIEELIASGMNTATQWDREFAHDLSLKTHPVFPVHAEVEGGAFCTYFENLLPKILEKFPTVTTLEAYARQLLQSGNIPVSLARLTSIPGRGGKVACLFEDELKKD